MILTLNFDTEQLSNLVQEAVIKAIEGISMLSTNVSPSQDHLLLTIDQAASLLSKKKQTIYRLVGKAEIPHYKVGNRLYFKREELLEWVNRSRRKTRSEITEEASAFIEKRRAA